MQKKIEIILIISIFLLISSCVEISQNIYLNDKSSGKMELTVIMPVEFKNEIGNYIKEKLSFLLKKKNCKLIEKDNLETKKHILTLIYNFKNIKEINNSLLNEYTFKKQGFLIKTYSLFIKYFPEKSDSKIKTKLKQFLTKKIPVSITITLPGKVKNFSNNLILKDNNTLMIKTNLNTLLSSTGVYTAQSSDALPLIIFIICIIIILGIIFFIKYFIPKKKQEEEDIDRTSESETSDGKVKEAEIEELVDSEESVEKKDESKDNNKADNEEEKKG